MDPFTRFSLRWDAPDLARSYAAQFEDFVGTPAQPILERAFTQYFLNAGPHLMRVSPEQAAFFGEPSEPFPDGYELYLGVGVSRKNTPVMAIQSFLIRPGSDATANRRHIENVVFGELERRTGPLPWLDEVISAVN